MLSTVILAIAFAFFVILLMKISNRPCASKACLIGKTAVITGATTGIGFHTALGLAARGCKVIIGCKVKADEARERIVRLTNNPHVRTEYLDLLSSTSIREFCAKINRTEDKLDILIHNAGILSDDNRTTEDGFNPVMQVNLFGPFLLTHLLVDLLKKPGHARIIFVSSCMAYFNDLSVDNLNVLNLGKKWRQVYANSKAGQVVISNELAERLKDYGITSNALHPGFVVTDIVGNLFNQIIVWVWYNVGTFIFKNPEEGAQNTLRLAISNTYRHITGTFLWTFEPKCAKNGTFRKQIWSAIEGYVKLNPHELI